MDDLRAGLNERLRQPPSASRVTGSLPVLFFGDLFTAEVAAPSMANAGRRGRFLSGDVGRLVLVFDSL